MNLVECLAELRRRGLQLRAQGESIQVDGPRGALTDALRDALRRHRLAILQQLRESAGEAPQALPPCVPDLARAHEPFPMSDLQGGFYLAQDAAMEWHVRPHAYAEKDFDDLDVARYEAAWNRTLQRHGRDIVVLRSDGQLQAVRDPAPLRCMLHDLGSLGTAEAADALAERRARMMRSELPLDRWPWLDLQVSRWTSQGRVRHRVHYNANTFFLDIQASARLVNEVERCYHDPALRLPALTLGTRDAVLALERLAELPAGIAARRYWEERVPRLPDPPAVPLRAGIDRRARSRLVRRELLVAPERWQALQQSARRHGLTPTSALFTAYAEVLSAWSNSRHFVLSNMVTRRLDLHPEIWELLGNFASLYPLEVDLRGDGTFAMQARRLQQQVASDMQHLHWGGRRVLQALNRRADGFGRAPAPYVAGSALFAERYERPGFVCLETPQVLLDNQLFALPDGRLHCVWDLIEDAFPAGLADAMWQAYTGLVGRLCDDAAAWTQVAPAFTPADQLEARARLTPLPRPLPQERLEEGLRHAARTAPHGIALLTPQARHCHAELDAAAAAIAQRLRAEGVRRGDTVAIVADRDFGFLAAVHGVLRAGGAYVPIDPALPDARREHLLGNSRAHCVVVPSADRAERLAWPAGVRVVVPGVEAPASHAAAGDAPVTDAGSTGDLAYVIYTSGSTGQPKGVMIEHRAAANTVRDVNERFGVGPADRLFGVSSCGFDLSVYDIFGAAAAGATLVYPAPREALNPAHWLDLLATQQVTVWNSAPPLAVLLAEAATLRGAQLPHLRLVMLSGDWIPVDLPDRLRGIAPNARIVSLGGATEASVWSIVYEIGAVDPSWPSIPYGQPMQNQPWQVLDECGRPTPDWVPGELYIGGDGLARGYWDDPARTAERFITHPATGERLYRTGDIGRYLPGGLIEFLGRRDAQVKIQGHRIELGEIESALLRCEGVQAAVVAVQAGPRGSTPRLAAYVVPTLGAAPEPAALQAALARTLPDSMVPRLYRLLDQLPLNVNGKVDRQALPRVDEPRPAAVAASEPPRDGTERQLLDIWREVLGRPRAGVADDFFDLGGQSFEAVRIVARASGQLGVQLSLADLLQARNVRALAARLAAPGAMAGVASCLVPLATGHAGEPLFLVHPAGGQVMCYHAMAAALGRPVHGLQAIEQPAQDGARPVEAFAKAYVEALARVHREGPLWLGGWSSGAPIAHEMAVQLQRAGREVRGLLVIDSPAPIDPHDSSDDQLLRWFVDDLELEPAVHARARAVLRSRAPVDERIRRLAEALHRHGLPLGRDPVQLLALFRTFSEVVRASRRHRAQPMALNTLVLRATQGQVSEFVRHRAAGRADWGWGLLSPHVTAHGVAATHFDLLRPPTLTAVIERVLAWLPSDPAEPAGTPARPLTTVTPA